MTAPQPIRKVLVANRGEIAVRVMRTLREMGIASVAVYSDADRAALHVRHADEAVRLGAPPPRESYLRLDALLDAARATGADALHPGYGFLSENPDLPDACAESGIRFIGPPACAMRLMGEKTAARARMKTAGVPVVPGTEGAVADLDAARAAARAIGFPLLLKAAYGGGGKGMRVVRDEGELGAAFRQTTGEAASAFGRGEVFLERWVERARHVEVQILADAHGGTIHLGERECSIQRRHQKLVEESPSAAVTPALRARMGEAAVRAAQAAGYVNAGTVEFLLEPSGHFYFLEMNTRLQVEHPVTEMVLGLDLVREQLRIAEGAPLSIRQEDVRPRGWAIECRVTAEDPERGFAPSVGTIRTLRLPHGPGVRNDTGIDEGYAVPVFYDALLAKLIVWGASRDEAIARLSRALDEYVIAGLPTSLAFHRWVVRDAAFRAGDLSTAFVAERYRPNAGRAEGRAGDAASLKSELEAALAAAGAAFALGLRDGARGAGAGTAAHGVSARDPSGDGVGARDGAGPQAPSAWRLAARGRALRRTLS
jgi:acetyl-CoA carboxylase biotin carboxylase subunit